ncbi:protease inhibitor I42 family protein [Chloroflexota bacterium]
MKMRLYYAMVMLIILAMAAAGCVRSNPHPVEMKVDVTCDEFMAQKHISKEVEVPLNGQLVVTLCSNPTTGFQWSETAQIVDQTILGQLNHKFVSPEANGDKAPAPGTPGAELWAFKATEKGTTQITMEYSRPWEGGEKGEWTFVLTVIVK